MRLKRAKTSVCALMATILLSGGVSRLLAYDIKLFPASEVYDRDVEFMHERLGVKGQPMKVEEFEDKEVESWLVTNLKPGADDTKDSAWAGSRASAMSNSGEFEIRLPRIRVFGVGLGDNDGGTEQISINGNATVELRRFPGHEINGSARAYYVLVLAQPNDPDILSVVFSHCITVNFDHVIALENKEPSQQPKLAPRLVLELIDGTRLVGDVRDDSMRVSVRAKDRDIRFEEIFSMKLQRGTNAATILLRDGEKVSCAVSWLELKVKTILGEISVPREEVTELRVTPRGEFEPGDARPERLKGMYHAEEPSYEGKSLRTWMRQRQGQPGAGNMYRLFDPDFDRETGEQQAATAAIRAIGSAAIPYLLELLSREPLESQTAPEGFAALGEIAKAAVPDLLRLLDEPRDIFQYGLIIRSIGGIGPAARNAIPALLQELRLSPYPTAAGEALGNIGPTASEAVPIIIAKLSKGDIPYDLPLVEALGKIPSKEAVPVLLAIAQERDSWKKKDESGFGAEMRRHRAVDALGKIGPEAEAAVPGLVGLLKSFRTGGMAGYYFSERVIRALGSIGPGAWEAVPMLRELAKESDQPRVSQAVAVALSKIGTRAR
jgi:HEAT repeat protein